MPGHRPRAPGHRLRAPTLLWMPRDVSIRRGGRDAEGRLPPPSNSETMGGLSPSRTPEPVHELAPYSCRNMLSSSYIRSGSVLLAHEAAVRKVVQRYVDAREASDAKAIESLFTPDADQLVSDRTWRRGRTQTVKGMLESSKKNPAKRAITVESVRFLSPEVVLADGRYIQKASGGGKDREMWTTITLKLGADGWRITAI